MNIKTLSSLILAAALLLPASCGQKQQQATFSCSISSPDGLLTASVGLTPDGQPCYKLERDGAEVVKTSRLGFGLAKGTSSIEEDLVIKNNRKGLKYSGESDLCTGFSIIGTQTGSLDETWQPVWGEERDIRNNYNELLVLMGREDGV